jgi:hypothetical protein
VNWQEARQLADEWVIDAQILPVKAADLESVLGVDLGANAALRANWEIVKKWNVDRRYQVTSEADARDLYQAVTDNTNGVLPWIRVRW